MKEILLGIHGRAQSGKTTSSKLLQKYHGFTEDSFASPIRNTLIQILGLNSLEALEEIKEIPHPLLGGNTPRYAMQTLGTEWGRNMIQINLWVDSFYHRNQNNKRTVSSDVRFNNESISIKDNGGFIVEIVTPESLTKKIKESDHVSEVGIDRKYIDFIISNDGTKGDLLQKWEDLLREKIFPIVDKR